MISRTIQLPSIVIEALASYVVPLPPTMMSWDRRMLIAALSVVIVLL